LQRLTASYAVSANGRFYFVASSTGSFGQIQLYSADSSGLPVPVTGPDLDSSFSFPGDLIESGDEIFFIASDNGLQRVYQIDDSGTTATQLTLPGIVGNVFDIADLGNDVGVIAHDGSGVDQIFIFASGGQPGEEGEATPLTSFTTVGFMSDLIRGGDDEFYFMRNTEAAGRELWMVDDTAPGGARLLADINLDLTTGGYDPQHAESQWV
jgi:ELWxxDGT repeat protein